MSSPDLSIIVVSWNTRELLRQCLESIDHTVDDLACEVIVVDNGSTDGSVELISEAFQHTILVCNSENRGFAAANNQGFSIARGRHVLLLNSDAVLLPRAARRMVDYLDSHAQVGIVGAQLLNPDQTYQGSCANFPTLLGEVLLLTGLARLVYGPTYPSPPSEKCTVERSVDWVCGACLMVRRAAAEAVGPLDEEYFMYTEETDWCFRMKGVGWGVAFLPSAQTIHRTGGSSHRVPERRRAQVYRSKWLFMRKHRGFLTAASFRALVRAISVIKLGVWLWMAIGPGPRRRELARGNVLSYRFLLAHF